MRVNYERNFTPFFNSTSQIGLREDENDSGVIKVWARRLPGASSSSLTIPVSGSITTAQVIREAIARFRLAGPQQQGEAAEEDNYHLVKVTLEAGRGEGF